MLDLLLKDHDLFARSNYKYPKFIYSVEPTKHIEKGIIELTNFNYAQYRVDYQFAYFDIVSHQDKLKEGQVKLAWKSYTFNEVIKNVTNSLELSVPTITDEFKRELWASTKYNRFCKVQGKRLSLQGLDISQGLLIKGANLSQSCLHGCYAIDCEVIEVDFSCSDLSGANFTRVVFDHCDFTHANSKDIQLIDCIFNYCKLDKIIE